MTAPANIICIKWGTKYPPYYVNRLYWGVRRFLSRDIRFVCFTDDARGIIPEVEIQPLPVEPFDAIINEMMDPKLAKAKGRKWGAWRKVSLYRRGLAGLTGPVLGLDLDIVITGPLDALIDYAPGKVCMRIDWIGERRGQFHANSSVFRFDPALHGYIYDEFAADPLGCAAKTGGQEQEHTSLTARAHGDLEYYPPQWISSFRYEAIPPRPWNWLRRPTLPPDARILCFHGHIKMESAVRGRPFHLRFASLPAPWLKDFWVRTGV